MALLFPTPIPPIIPPFLAILLYTNAKIIYMNKNGSTYASRNSTIEELESGIYPSNSIPFLLRSGTRVSSLTYPV